MRDARLARQRKGFGIHVSEHQQRVITRVADNGGDQSLAVVTQVQIRRSFLLHGCLPENLTVPFATLQGTVPCCERHYLRVKNDNQQFLMKVKEIFQSLVPWTLP